MDKVILYLDTEGNLVVLYPIPTESLPIEEIAKKDVPENVGYKIVSKSILPKETAFMQAWEYEFTDYDGYGIGQIKWEQMRQGIQK